MSLLRRIITCSLVVLGPVVANAATPGISANATSYEITVTKVELCRSSACDSPFVLGSSSKSFDIAAVSAGADVGNYIDIKSIPLYQTWSHVRVTMSTTISITASGQDDSANNCNTDSTNNASTHTSLGVSAAGAASLQNFVVPDVGAFAGNPNSSDYAAYNLSKTDGASTMTVTYALPTPYTCKGKMPRIEVKFNTQGTLNFYDASGSGGAACSSYPLPPNVTITVSDP